MEKWLILAGPERSRRVHMKKIAPNHCWLIVFLLIQTTVVAQKTIRISCVGNSITFGSKLAHPEKDAYPAQLQQLLGTEYEVKNFGVGGRTVIKDCDRSYMATPAYQEALKSNPDIVTIKLGTNDSRLPYRLQIDSFMADYKTLVHSFQKLPTHPRIILLLPVTSYLTDTMRQTEQAIAKLILPRIRQVAFEEKLELIDLHSITAEMPTTFPDSLHPSSLGATILAKRLYEVVTNKTDNTFDIFKKIKVPFADSSFYGYDCANFMFNGRKAKIVKPRRAAQGKPWIWRARFWGAEPQTEIALLDRGFHVVYCDVTELFGNAEAIDAWNKFYSFLQKAGLSKKACLEGFSRGGIYVYNWAAQNADKVACLYVDAPVLDVKSWPGGKGSGKGSAANWEIFKKDYGYTSDSAALSFKGNPIDKVEQIVQGGYPMLHVVGDADDIVPVNENTAIFEQKVLALGGKIEVIHKPGVNHHPHSLANPTPIVDFILKATQQKVDFAVISAPGSEYRFGNGSDWWDNYNDIQHTLDSIGKVDILLLGNSITQAIGHRSLEPKGAGTRAFDSVLSAYKYGVAGIRGDRTQHLLWRVQHTDFSKANPAVVVVTIGVNNFRDDDADNIVAGIRSILKVVEEKLPKAMIILTGPLPTGNTPNDLYRKKYQLVHQQIKQFVNDKSIFFCDPSRSLIDTATGKLAEGCYRPDGIHLTEKGYTMWAGELYPVIKSIMVK
jgi:lysophospholipase L1-like esterase/pimeloyl-ACP methyl ester carboxylesterase